MPGILPGTEGRAMNKSDKIWKKILAHLDFFPAESVDTKLDKSVKSLTCELLTNAGVKKRKRDMKYYRERLKF